MPRPTRALRPAAMAALHRRMRETGDRQCDANAPYLSQPYMSKNTHTHTAMYFHAHQVTHIRLVGACAGHVHTYAHTNACNCSCTQVFLIPSHNPRHIRPGKRGVHGGARGCSEAVIATSGACMPSGPQLPQAERVLREHAARDKNKDWRTTIAHHGTLAAGVCAAGLGEPSCRTRSVAGLHRPRPVHMGRRGHPKRSCRSDCWAERARPERCGRPQARASALVFVSGGSLECQEYGCVQYPGWEGCQLDICTPLQHSR